MAHSHSFIGPFLMFAVWIVQVLIAYLIWKDAKEQKMLAPVWTILAVLPMFGYLVDVLYLLIRELRPSRKAESPAAL
jgi:uncharacterized MAPEG superfamily protein